GGVVGPIQSRHRLRQRPRRNARRSRSAGVVSQGSRARLRAGGRTPEDTGSVEREMISSRANTVPRRIAILVMVLAAGVLPALAHADDWGLALRDATPPPGAEVTAVQSGALADAAGIEVGDVIVKVQGKPLANATQF